MIGAHLARLLAAVGYDVKQAFYVNDLGAQVRCCDQLLRLERV
jgi:arginyl-tRNA synthetase